MLGLAACRRLPQAPAAFARVTRSNIPRIGLAPVVSVRHNSSNVSEIKTKLTDFSTDAAGVSDTITTSLHSDQVGYMASIGIGEGWGPTASIANILELMHVYTGLPWWATIACTTFAIRGVMFPLYVKASANTAKMSKIKPQIDELMEVMKTGDQADKTRAMMLRSKLYKENGIKASHSFFPLLQLPIAYGFYLATRQMALFPVEGFASQGAFWFENLCEADPYLGLQLLSAFVVTGMMRSGGETGAQAMNPMFKKVMTWLPFLSIFVTYNMSASILVYFAANGIFSFVQSLVLKNRHFRKFANIPPIQKPQVVPGAKPPPATIGEWWNDYNAKLKEQTKAKMEKTNRQLETMEKRKGMTSDGFIKRH